MKKIYSILLGLIISSGLYSQYYSITYNSAAGNPGVLNTEADNTTAGWTALTPINQTVNGWTASQTLPFNFYIFGYKMTSFIASYNGLIRFDYTGGALGTDNILLPTNGVNGPASRVIACFWELFPASYVTATVYTKVFGTAPNRQLWIKWYFNNSLLGSLYYSCVLEESTQNVYMVDCKLTAAGSSMTTTVGVQSNGAADNATGSPNIALTINGTTSRTDNSYYKFTPLPPVAPPVPTLVHVNCGPQTLTKSTYLVPANVIYYWQDQTCGTDNSNEDVDYIAYTTGFYYLRAYDTLTKKWSTSCSSEEVLYVNDIPPTPTFSISANTCGNKTLTLTSSAPADGGVYWQGTSCGIAETLDATVANYTAASTGTYNLRSFSWGYDGDMGIWKCWSPCGAQVVTVNQPPATPPTPQLTSSNTCGDKTITTTAPPGGESFYWQTASNGTSTVNGSLNLQVSTTGTTYLRSRTTAGCWSNSSSSIAVTVKPLPSDPPALTISPNSCGDKTVSVTKPPVNVTYYWQTAVDGVTMVLSDTIRTISASGNYYLRAYHNSGCWSNSSSLASISVYGYPSDPPVPQVSSNVCGDKTLTRNNPPFNVTYYWQDSASGTKISDLIKNKIASTPGTYYLRAQTSDGGCWSKNSSSLFVTVLNPYDQEKICLVTLDPATSKNRIIWERTSGKRTVSYNLYKIVSSNFTLIGNMKFDSLSVFIDAVSNPETEPFQYAITTVDSCGNESAKSPTHQTMRLWSSVSTEANSANINWYKYVDASGIFVPDSFYIYKGATKDKMTLYAAQPATNKEIQIYTDNAFFGPVAYYQVGVKKTQPCSPAILKAESGPYTQSLSNIAEYKMTGMTQINSLQVVAYPNPFSENFTIEFSLDKNSDVLIEVVNATGQKTAEFSYKNLAAGNQQIQLNATEMKIAEGICYLKIVANEKTNVIKCNLVK
jgi:hypothetical protein